MWAFCGCERTQDHSNGDHAQHMLLKKSINDEGECCTCGQHCSSVHQNYSVLHTRCNEERRSPGTPPKPRSKLVHCFRIPQRPNNPYLGAAGGFARSLISRPRN